MRARSSFARWIVAAAAAWLVAPTGTAHAETPTKPKPPRLERYSTPMLVSGIVLSAASGPLLFGGLALRLGSTAMDCPGGCPLTGTQQAGLGMMIGSAAALAVGIPLIVLGNRKVPRDEPAARVFVGMGTATLRLSF